MGRIVWPDPPDYSPEQIGYLLGELCVRLGFCIPPEAWERLTADPPRDVDRFTDRVFEAEGLPVPSSGPLRDQVRAVVASYLDPPPLAL